MGDPNAKRRMPPLPSYEMLLQRPTTEQELKERDQKMRQQFQQQMEQELLKGK